MQSSLSVQFGIAKPWARKEYKQAHEQFEALSAKAVELGEKIKPFFPDQKTDEQVAESLLGMARKFLELKDLSLIGSALKKERALWQKTLKDALNKMHYEGGRGRSVLTTLSDELRQRFGSKADSLVSDVTAATLKEANTIRMYSGPLPGGGRIDVM